MCRKKFSTGDALGRQEAAKGEIAPVIHARASRFLGCAQFRPSASIPRPFAGSLVGTAIVLACLILPFVLWRLAIWTEDTAKDGYVRTLQATVKLSPAPGPSQLVDQHYYFVNGCVAPPGECENANAGSWGEYYDELRTLYEQAVQSAATHLSQPFEEWAGVHAHFINSLDASDGAYKITRSLKENKAGAAMHMVGTSAGGSAIFSYLSQAMRGEVPLDRRIRSVVTIDAPLGCQALFGSPDALRGLLSLMQASNMRSDVEYGLGEWAKAAGIRILTIDTLEDIVGQDPLPDIPDDQNPKYPDSDNPPTPAYINCTSLPCRLGHFKEYFQRGVVWHIYTGSHISDSARQFIDEEWR